MTPSTLPGRTTNLEGCPSLAEGTAFEMRQGPTTFFAGSNPAPSAIAIAPPVNRFWSAGRRRTRH